VINLIIAVDQGNAIGWSDGRLAYPGLKQDMARFKELTTNSTVVMGRSTYLSLGRPAGLPNRRNIVLTRKPYSEVRGTISSEVEIISSLDWVAQHAAASKLTTSIIGRQTGDIWIIGGASVYDEALKKGIVDEIYLTLVHAVSEADVRMETDLASWRHFIITEKKQGRIWAGIPTSRQWDGEVETSYVNLIKHP
jgi:dihydrofolate reductase